MRRPENQHDHGIASSSQLSAETWPDFERLFASNGGVWGGCWCMFFHSTGTFDAKAYGRNRSAKHALVDGGGAHGTIVYCGDDPVGWCQFGPKEELRRVDGKKGYSPTADNPWRITCIFIAPGHRGSGLARLAVSESVRAMKKLKVKTVEAYPVEGESKATFLWAGTPHLFEREGFIRVRPLGKRSWIYSLDLGRGGRRRGEQQV
ncbi:MAG: GNAT family N-acetyltransferase [Nitrososphaerota archaeon]|nr:GNAT family N-acetyltransferase [Nitrososphaerota archaeon]